MGCLVQVGPSPPPTPTEGGDCNWIEAGERDGQHIDLPPFPHFPAKFRLPPVIPLPRLLPKSWDSVMSRVRTVDVTAQRAAAVGEGLSTTPSATVALLGAVSGAAAAAALVLGASVVWRQCRQGRVAMRDKALSRRAKRLYPGSSCKMALAPPRTVASE